MLPIAHGCTIAQIVNPFMTLNAVFENEKNTLRLNGFKWWS